MLEPKNARSFQHYSVQYLYIYGICYIDNRLRNRLVNLGSCTQCWPKPLYCFVQSQLINLPTNRPNKVQKKKNAHNKEKKDKREKKIDTSVGEQESKTTLATFRDITAKGVQSMRQETCPKKREVRSANASRRGHYGSLWGH